MGKLFELELYVQFSFFSFSQSRALRGTFGPVPQGIARHRVTTATNY